MLVTGGTHAGEFLRLLGNGHEFGIDRLSTATRKGRRDRRGARLGRRFVDGEPVLVMLADNIVEGSIGPWSMPSAPNAPGRRILLTPVRRTRASPPSRSTRTSTTTGASPIVEKPEDPPSRLRRHRHLLLRRRRLRCDPDPRAIGRGELEITDVNNYYVDQGTMAYDVLDGFWGDAGESIDAYYAVNDFVRQRGQQGLTRATQLALRAVQVSRKRRMANAEPMVPTRSPINNTTTHVTRTSSIDMRIWVKTLPVALLPNASSTMWRPNTEIVATSAPARP